LEVIAEIYWLVVGDKGKEGNQIPETPIDSVDDPTPGGEDKQSGTDDQSTVVEEQEEELQKSLAYSKPPAGVVRVYVPDISKDMNLAKAFNIFHSEMDDLNAVIDQKTSLAHMLGSIVEQSRYMGDSVRNKAMIPQSITRHDVTILAAGWKTGYYQHRRSVGRHVTPKWDIYVDVPSSMEKEVPLARYIANQLTRLCNKMYCFSAREPIPYDGGSWVYSRISTEMSVCFEHSYKNGIRNMIVIGDGKDSHLAVDIKLVKGLEKWAKEANTIMLLTKSSSYPYSSILPGVFKSIYDLETDELTKGDYHELA
jgi:hypothetical protein